MSLSPDFKLNNTTTTTTAAAATVECVENDIVSSQLTTSRVTNREAQVVLPQLRNISKTEDGQSPTTPTSPSNRIPEVGSCPRAPMKPKSKPNLKRKLLFSDSCVHTTVFGNINNNNVHTSSNTSSHSVTQFLDFSREVDSMFPSNIQVNFGRKIKKARSI